MIFDRIVRSLLLGMHIPDGFLAAPVALLWWGLSIAAIAVAVRRIGLLEERQVPLMGVMAAFIFAAQMLNFPVLGGTSGHLLGGALAALLLGPWAAILVMACVITLQALLFQDGGLLALGANIFNMGVATATIGYLVGMPILRRFGNRPVGLIVGGFVSGWLSVLVAAALTSLQLVLSGLAAGVVFPAMLFVHSFIGIGEGLITAAALAFVAATRPDLVLTMPGGLSRTAGQSAAAKGTLVVATVVGLGIAVGAALLAPLASSDPDGLERVAEDQGFLSLAQNPSFSLLPDYTLPGLTGPLSTIIAGIVGLLIVFAIAYGISLLLRGRNASADDPATRRGSGSQAD